MSFQLLIKYQSFKLKNNEISFTNTFNDCCRHALNHLCFVSLLQLCGVRRLGGALVPRGCYYSRCPQEKNFAKRRQKAHGKSEDTLLSQEALGLERSKSAVDLKSLKMYTVLILVVFGFGVCVGGWHVRVPMCVCVCFNPEQGEQSNQECEHTQKGSVLGFHCGVVTREDCLDVSFYWLYQVTTLGV